MRVKDVGPGQFPVVLGDLNVFEASILLQVDDALRVHVHHPGHLRMARSSKTFLCAIDFPRSARPHPASPSCRRSLRLSCLRPILSGRPGWPRENTGQARPRPLSRISLMEGRVRCSLPGQKGHVPTELDLVFLNPTTTQLPSRGSLLKSVMVSLESPDGVSGRLHPSVLIRACLRFRSGPGFFSPMACQRSNPYGMALSKG